MEEGNIDQIVVAPSDAGQRLDLFLAAKIDRLSRARIQALIQSGHILLNGAICRAKQIVQPRRQSNVSEPKPEPIMLAARSAHGADSIRG